MEGYRAIIEQMRKHGISIPIVAIGGIGKEDIPAIMACGVSGIALSGSILNAQDPVTEMQNVLRLL